MFKIEIKFICIHLTPSDRGSWEEKERQRQGRRETRTDRDKADRDRQIDRKQRKIEGWKGGKKSQRKGQTETGR